MAERLYVLRGGCITMPKRWVRVGGSDEPMTIPVLAFLVVAGDRLVLIDSGCSPVVTEDPDKAWGSLTSLYHPHIGPDDLIDAQIRRAGFEVGDVTDVVLTHLHFDHAGGLRMLDHPRVWVQRAEHRWGGCPDGHAAGGYFKQEYDLPGLDLQLLDGDATIADGVQCVLTAGHTPGHQSVLVRLPSGLVCVVGDAAYNRQMLDRRSLPAVAWDVSRYMSALTRLSTLETFFGAQLLFSHDPAQVDDLPEGSDFLN
ncbi:MAG TPA: N-acyl homoserine lactonase family protein [Propionibacteriaceae bacterium]